MDQSAFCGIKLNVNNQESFLVKTYIMKCVEKVEFYTFYSPKLSMMFALKSIK